MIYTITSISLAMTLMMSAPQEAYQLIQSVKFSSPDTRVMHRAELFGPIIRFPQGMVLKIDGKVVGRIESGNAMSRIMLGDVTNDRLDEVFLFQNSFGSAGAMGLTVYSLVDNDWKPIFTSSSVTTGNDKERFNSEYAGNKRIRFYDQGTGLSGVLDMSVSPFPEERLRMMRFQTDPISEIVVHYENMDCIIETVQWIFAFSHPNAAFSVHNFYLYNYVKRKFLLYETKMQDTKGVILARK
ncbi:hypothetical protein [Cohnella luojiensis]|uniref:Uncharacterized protein n=1 Tax=Cohnella luojiensis TaxID=652876 RepID=A0A4Y8LV99_9BACL|nr:hypothetical protein [Cohnella luojiensis]TFE24839.1 hypothetical protein E2980_14930 [Cohnella luojiensis]